MSNETDSSTDDFIAATMCGVTSLICFIVNAGVAVTLVKHRDLRNSFSTLCVSLACADCGVLSVFLLMVTPLTYTQDKELSHSIPGHISLTFWFASLYNMLAICTNRLVAIFWPTKYKVIFNNINTKKTMLLTWFLAGCHCAVYFIPGCNFIYDPPTYGWFYEEGDCYDMMYFFDFYYGILFVFLLFVINIATGIEIRRMNRKQKKKVMSTRQEIQDAKRYKREVRFFLQSFLNAMMFEFMLISFHVISRFITGKMTMFIATGWLWQISHGTNGFLVLIFNAKVRKRFLGGSAGIASTTMNNSQKSSGHEKSEKTHSKY